MLRPWDKAMMSLGGVYPSCFPLRVCSKLLDYYYYYYYWSTCGNYCCHNCRCLTRLYLRSSISCSWVGRLYNVVVDRVLVLCHNTVYAVVDMVVYTIRYNKYCIDTRRNDNFKVIVSWPDMMVTTRRMTIQYYTYSYNIRYVYIT